MKSDKIKGITFIILAAAGFSLMSLFVRLSGDLPELRKEAEVTVLAANHVRLTPIGGMLVTIAKAVEIEFSDDLTHVVCIRIEEKTGDILSIHFRNAILNQPIPEEVWILK